MPVIDDRAWWLKKAQQADENAKWNIDRANRALRENRVAAYKDHMSIARSYQKDADNYRYLAKKCTK